MRWAALCLLCGFLTASCTPGPQQADVVTNIAYESIVPSLDEASTLIDELADQVETFCLAPTGEGQNALVAVWREAKSSWEAGESMAPFGPASMLRTVSMVDYEPISEEGIDDLLASEETLTTDYVANRLSSTRRGLGAIEYTVLGQSESVGLRECELATAASTVAAEATAELHSAWAVAYGGGAAFVDDFTESMTSKEALGDVVGAIVETLKRQELFEIGQATGHSATSPDVLAIPEGNAGFGAGRYLAQLGGIDEVLCAGEDTSLIELIRSRSPEVAEGIETHLNAAIAKMTEFDKPLREIASEQPALLDAYLVEISELRSLFEADVVSLLDITLGFSDSDGDTG